MELLEQARAGGLTKVLIVAKTRRGSRACIGGITSAGQSVRLVAADEPSNETAGMEYSVGEVWAVDARPAVGLRPPHTENVIVHAAGGAWARCLIRCRSIERYMPPQVGGIDVLYDGLAASSPAGPLFICERTGVPGYSTMFWRPDQDLTARRRSQAYPLPLYDARGRAHADLRRLPGTARGHPRRHSVARVAGPLVAPCRRC